MSIRKDIAEKRFGPFEYRDEFVETPPDSWQFPNGQTVKLAVFVRLPVLYTSVERGNADPLALIGKVNREPIGSYPAGTVLFVGADENGLRLAIRPVSWNHAFSSGGNWLPIVSANGQPPYSEVDLPEEEPAEVEAPAEEAPAGDEEPTEPETDPGAGTTEPAA